ncbi:protein-tyrosine-phosphatase [Sphaerochaeta pleomorpha str. Grapes]|uniref:protein-tyrosine-phosphatase n=2 Tax=Sphaerochaeta TaxID=399320 RepID=G8QS80_SPHPG|nr:protein-tyrosine-phosphatase [Sphaerochaeta pleomorpha str. Grapes]
MAEFMLKDMVGKLGLSDQFCIASSATSREEIGNGIHPGTKAKLREQGIAFANHRAIQLRSSDYDSYDLLLGMDENNKRNMLRIFCSDPQEKIHRLLDYTPSPRDIADPWYTENFEATFKDIRQGCLGLLDYLASKNR